MKRERGLGSMLDCVGNSVGVLIPALLLVLLLSPARATDRTWNGAGDNNNWTTGANWGGTAPEEGNSLIFAGSTRPTPSNDFTADTAFGGLTFNAGAGAFTLGGNRITLGGNVASAAANNQTIGLNLLLGATRTFDVSGAGDLTLSGDLSGDGGLTKTGGKRLVLTGSNSYAGVTTVSEGTLKADSASAFSPSSGTILVQSGATLDIGASMDLDGGRIEIAGSGVDENGALLSSSLASRSINNTRLVMTADATIQAMGAAGAQFLPCRYGTLDMDGYTLTKTGTGTMNIRDVVVTNAADMVVTAGILRIQDNTGSIHADAPFTITVTNNAALDFWGTGGTQIPNVTLHNTASFLNGQRNATFTGTITLNGANHEIGSSYLEPVMTLAGKITGSGGFATRAHPSRLSILVLTNTDSDYTGNTVVNNNGILRVSNTSGSATGSGTVTVQNGGVLSGTGFISGGVVINGGGILSPANVDGQIGTLTFNSNLTLNDNAVLKVDFDATQGDLVVVGGTVTLPAALDLDLNNLDASQPESIALIAAAGGFVGSPAEWPDVQIDDKEYQFSIAGDTLQLAPRSFGTVILLQ